MPDGFMIWFLRGKTTERVVNHLSATGAALAYPMGEGRVSVLDREGTQELVSTEAFMSLLCDNDAPTLTFQTWYSTSDDMIVTIHRGLTEVSSNATFYAMTCYLDGLELEQIESATAGVDQILSRSPGDVVGVMIDRRGGTEDFDWHAFMCDPSAVPPVPDRLIVRREAVDGHLVDRDAWSMGDPTPAFATLADAGLRNPRWDVVDRYLATTIGSHRTSGWSLGKAREAAFAGVWNDMVGEFLAPVQVRPLTDPNINSSCVYEMANGDTIYVSTVLPYVIAWSAGRNGFMDAAPPWAKGLIDTGFVYLDSTATHTLSPYFDTDAERRITYFEILFEWTEGSDGPDESTLIDPWRP